jgi:alcohol-forming fatty acyl-CoA reductase
VFVLLTGVTGFIGKVVLATLLRDRERLQLERVALLIRPRATRGASERFEREVAASLCLSAAPPDFRSQVEVVAGDVSRPGLGLNDADAERLRRQTTHILHVAASTDFNSPLADAAHANVRSALGVLEFAQSCTRLARLVHTSTAYVTPHRPGALTEALEPPAFDPESTWREIERGVADQQRLLQQSGHPNTYTFSKCLAEHLLAQRRGNVPLSLVRPSIVSAAWRFPQRGWVDSRAAYTGFVALYLLGRLDVIVADPNTRLDIVPVDIVAERLVERAVRARDVFDVTHVVAGLGRACRVRELEPNARQVKRQFPTGARQARLRLRSPGLGFALDDLVSHQIPFAVADTVLGWRGDRGGRKQLARLRRAITSLQNSFAHFSRREYDFTEQSPWSWPRGFDPFDYHAAIVEGVYRHLLQLDAKAVLIGGQAQRIGEGSWSWGLRRGVAATPGQRARNTALRWGLRSAARSVTYDRRSFDAALASHAAAPGCSLAFVPTYRSRLDTRWCSYLVFDQPGLDWPLPAVMPAHIARPEAWLARRAPESPFQFFIEGERSCSREMLPPRQHVLEAIQRSGRPCLLVPVAIAYDRMPEEAVSWGTHDLGRIHLRAGAPAWLEPGADAALVARLVAAELQRAMVVSTFHLRAFLAGHPALPCSVAELQAMLEARGATVIDSSLLVPQHVSPAARRALEGQFRAWLTDDALRLWPEDPELRRYARDHRYVASLAAASDDERARQVAAALFEKSERSGRLSNSPPMTALPLVREPLLR